MKHILCILKIHKYEYHDESKKMVFKISNKYLSNKNIRITVRKCVLCNKRDYKSDYRRINKWKKYKFKLPIKEERIDKLKNIYKKEKL